MSNTQKGFTGIEIVLVAATIAALGFAGWTYYQANLQEPASTTDENTQTNQVNKQSGNDSEETTQKYENKRFSIKLPANWEFAGSEGNLMLVERDDGLPYANHEVYKFADQNLHFYAHIYRGGRGAPPHDLSWEYKLTQEGNQFALESVSTSTEVCPNASVESGFCSSDDNKLSIYISTNSSDAEDFAFETKQGEMVKPIIYFTAGNSKSKAIKSSELEQFKFLLNHIKFKNQKSS